MHCRRVYTFVMDASQVRGPASLTLLTGHKPDTVWPFRRFAFPLLFSALRHSNTNRHFHLRRFAFPLLFSALFRRRFADDQATRGFMTFVEEEIDLRAAQKESQRRYSPPSGHTLSHSDKRPNVTQSESFSENLHKKAET